MFDYLLVLMLWANCDWISCFELSCFAYLVLLFYLDLVDLYLWVFRICLEFICLLCMLLVVAWLGLCLVLRAGTF